MVYDICFDTASLIIGLTAFICTSGQIDKKNARSLCFRQLQIALMAALSLDMLGAVLISYPEALPVRVNMFIQALGFLSIFFVTYKYMQYIEMYFQPNPFFRKFNNFVLLAYVILHVLNIFFEFMYYFDSSLVYTRGPAYLIVYAAVLYLYAYCVVTMCIHRKRFEKRQFIATMMLIPIVIVSSVLQYGIMSNYLFSLFAVAVSVMILTFTVEFPDVRKLEATRQELADANNAKSDFLANMSHEIRTPMNAIVGMCELILREPDISEQVRENCFNIQSSGRSLLSIINDILDFSKIESGKLEIIEDKFNITSTLNDVLNMAVARKGDKKLEMIVHVDPEIPVGLIGDEIRIRQVIINFVTNAIKYSNEGCVSIRVSQTKRDYGINLSVSVADTGIGITEENLEKLFSSFQQVDTRKNRSVEGTGLGLAISKRLVSKMGGFINVSSEYGKGSVFSFVIPLKVSDPKPFISIKNKENIRAAGYINFKKMSNETTVREYRTLISELGSGFGVSIEIYDSIEELRDALEKQKYSHIFTAREEYSANEDFFLGIADDTNVVLIQDRIDAAEFPKSIRCMYKPFYALSAAAVLNNESITTNIGERRNADTHFVAPAARVLIVDDNPINLKVAVGLMRPYHMQVITADSADAAVFLLRSKDFHIVFMDHMMPVVDGIDATKMIRAFDDEYYKKLPIIALTANAVSGAREMFLEAGMNDFIAKPIELSALDRALRAWLPKNLIKAAGSGGEYQNDCRKPTSCEIDTKDDTFNPKTGVFYTGGDSEAYIEVLQMFVSKAEEKRKYIQKLFDDKDWKNYVIEVHALKSSSLSCGSKTLSNSAKELELAGKAGNYSLITKKNAALMELYERVAEKGREYLEQNAPEEKTAESEDRELTEITLEKAVEYLDKIREACAAFDGDMVEEICQEVEIFSCSGNALKPIFDSIKSSIDEFEYDEAAEKASAAEDKLKGGDENV